MGKKSNFFKLLDFDADIAKIHKEVCLIGIDEVGRGALAGPVIACAFAWKENILNIPKRYNKLFSKLNDSKQLTSEERNILFKDLVIYGDFSLGYASVLEIEKHNILQATYLAMRRAFDGFVLQKQEPSKKLSPYLLVDGNKLNPFINCRQVSIIQGDTKSSLIASASIIAKVYRDMLMHRISKDEKYEHFGWQRNVGYGTASHCRAIKKHGLTPLHRKLFVRKIFV